MLGVLAEIPGGVMVVQYERGMAYHTPPKKLPQSHLRLRFALGELFIKSTGPLI